MLFLLCFSMDWFTQYGLWPFHMSSRFLYQRSLQLQIHRLAGLIIWNNRLPSCISFFPTMDDVPYIQLHVWVWLSRSLQLLYVGGPSVLCQTPFVGCWDHYVGNSCWHAWNNSIHPSASECIFMARNFKRICPSLRYLWIVLFCLCAS